MSNNHNKKSMTWISKSFHLQSMKKEKIHFHLTKKILNLYAKNTQSLTTCLSSFFVMFFIYITSIFCINILCSKQSINKRCRKRQISLRLHRLFWFRRTQETREPPSQLQIRIKARIHSIALGPRAIAVAWPGWYSPSHDPQKIPLQFR